MHYTTFQEELFVLILEVVFKFWELFRPLFSQPSLIRLVGTGPAGNTLIFP